MIIKTRALVIGALLVSSTLAGAPATAQIPTIDPSLIAKAGEQLATAGKALATAQQQLNTAKETASSIGQVGQGNFNNILSDAGINLSGPQNVLQNVQSIANTAQQVPNFAAKLPKIPGERAITLKAIQTVNDGREAASQMFYSNGGKMTQEAVTSLRDRRNTVLRETAVNAYGAASAIKGKLTEASSTSDALAKRVGATVNMREDIAAGNAIMLNVYLELQKQTAMSAQLLELEAARTLAADSTGLRTSADQ
ncbi:hypothetical protein [Sphingosinicella sp. BN140058]|uniref:hypothetical protein n=1 Tax=Sphingosinicella sp. BN140058 TaxID=1892855 RepID=UPI0010107F2A|nr:hypothetical protein [Sphingosinicella sp. BN140058]QAY80216.1 hypothetical protein ETR14_26600 [Sphingosinicella sp. BN140058]